ncbi:hypothetical protein N7453_009669 [Penicillium expansum]|nr:hypothetical protein N7453_009669 [Penicillium expansum]
MDCLSSTSFRSLLPNWTQSLWISEREQSGEHLDQTVPNTFSPYTGTDPAIYELQNTEVTFTVKRPLPVCISSQTERVARARTKRIENYISTRPPAISMKFDDKTDCDIIVLPDIPLGVEFAKGRITCMGEEHLSPEWSTMCLKNNKLAVILLSNISQGSSSQ